MKTPRYLLGAALLFWGWQTNLLIWAAPMALLIEASHFIRARWEFSITDLNRIWNLCAVLFFGAGVILYTSEDNIASIPLKFAQWLPFPFFPMMLTQAYGNVEKIPMSVFSWFLRRSPHKPMAKKSYNISFAYFGLCLLAASATDGSSPYFYPGIVALVCFALMAHRPMRLPQPVWILLIAAVGFAGHLGHQQLRNLHSAVEGTLARWFVSMFSRDYRINESRTAIGRVGKIQLSGKIVLRVQPESGDHPPGLLREASYDSFYKGRTWRSTESEFGDIFTETNDVVFLQSPKNLNFSAQISSYLKRGRGRLFLPHGVYELTNFPAVLKTNRFGVAKVEEGPGLLNLTAFYGPGTTIDSEPTQVDREVPPREEPAVAQIVDELDLEGKSERKKIETIRNFFKDKFTYSLTITPEHIDPTGEKTPLGQFLTETRSGHCEYFASAAVMLLRQAGIPARYATGYVVDESGRKGKTYLVRERDAHAWVLAYREDKKIWEEFDATPPSSERAENAKVSAWEPITDFFSHLKYLFSKWRWGQSTYTDYLKWILIPLVLFLVWRIISSKRRRKSANDLADSHATVWPGLDSEFFLLEQRMLAAGLGRASDESLDEWKARLSSAIPESENLDQIFKIHRRLRFDPHGIPATDRQMLRNDVNRFLKAFDAQKERKELAAST